MKKRTVALLCAAVMLLGVIFGGTMAWLSRGTNAVVNTFTTANVGLDLTETTGPEYIMVPGTVLDKDPKVVVAEDSASCYLFVKVEEKNFTDPAAPITYAIADGWNEVEGIADLKTGETVYYRVFNEKTPGAVEEIKDADGKVIAKGHVYPVLKDSQVSISDTVTKDDLEAYKMNPHDKSGKLPCPELNFTAYAIQRDYLKDANGNELTEIADIWALAQAPSEQA